MRVRDNPGQKHGIRPEGGSHDNLISRILCSAEADRHHLSRPAVTDWLDRPTLRLGRAPFCLPDLHFYLPQAGRSLMADNAGLHGLSTPGVYLAAGVATGTGGLLPHPFTLTLL
jgi:hypothetical protein